MSDALTTEAAADDEDGVNSPNTQKRLDFAAALKKDAPSPGVARRIIEGADGGVRIARVVPACPRKSPRQTSPPPRRAQDGGEHTPKTRRRIANMLVEGKDAGLGKSRLGQNAGWIDDWNDDEIDGEGVAAGGDDAGKADDDGWTTATSAKARRPPPKEERVSGERASPSRNFYRAYPQDSSG